MTIQFKYKLKPESWFKENCYSRVMMEDIPYYWRNKNDYEMWNAMDKPDIHPLGESTIQKGVLGVVARNDYYAWGIERELTPESDPEYFV